MTSKVLGRTNQAFPNIWLSLEMPAGGAETQDLASSAAQAGCPLDISRHPALWGALLRGSDALLLAASNSDVERATDEKHAADLLQAHLIETLCCIGRETIDFYCLRVRKHLQEYQVSGALEALESARQEGHIRFLALWAEEPNASRSAWQVHDAFDVAVLPRSHFVTDTYSALAPLARERRVGLVTSAPFDWGLESSLFDRPSLAEQVLADLSAQHPVLVPVRSAAEVKTAVESVGKDVPDNFLATLDSMRNDLTRAYAGKAPYGCLGSTHSRRVGGPRAV